MNYVRNGVHHEIVRRLREGHSIRRIAADLGIAKGTVQVRKAQLVWEGYDFPECKGGRVRPRTSTTYMRRMAAVSDYYGIP